MIIEKLIQFYRYHRVRMFSLNRISRILLFYFIGLFPLLLQAQQNKAPQMQDSVSPENKREFFFKDSSGQVDMADVLYSIIHKKKHMPMSPKKHEVEKTHISILPGFGYTLQTGFAGVITGNVAFYNGASENQKISSIKFDFGYTQYNQFIIPLQANIWSKANKYNFIADWRYLKYPSFTYGLGGRTLLSNGYIVDFSYLKIHQSVFKSIGKNLYAGLGYYLDYLWNIQEIKPIGVTSFEKYGFSPIETASGVALRLLYDSRLNQINPLKGFYSNIVYRPNFTFLGSQTNWQSLLIEFRKYVPFPSGSKNVISFWSYNWLTTSGKPPYLLLPSTGWDDLYNTGRGYIQGRFRGKNMIYFEAEYRFGITRNGLFGGVIFANAQSFSKPYSQAAKLIEPAVGTGVRIKFNKISGTNLCIDYGFGLNGSRGIFVNLTEVF
jgi:hypothetical protein